MNDELGYAYQMTTFQSGDVFVTAELYVVGSTRTFHASSSVWFRSTAAGASNGRVFLDADGFGSKTNDGYFSFETLTPGTTTVTAHDSEAPGAVGGVRTYTLTGCSDL